MKSITVFTPTYNRAHLLPRLYESLLRQTSDDFCWLIIDDGSTDDTRERVAGWQAEGRIQIQYEYKANGGMHTAHNRAYDLIQTELNVCIDSDDWMPDDAVERILSVWALHRANSDVVGLIGLDVDSTGKTVGSALPVDGTHARFNEIYQKYRCSGDKKLVYRNSVTAGAPRFPEFAHEKLVPLGWLYMQLDQQGLLVTMNEPLIVVEYQPDGSSANVLKQYFQSPRGFRALRVVNIRFADNHWFRVKNIIHFGFSSMAAGEWTFLSISPVPVSSLLLFPASLVLYLGLRMKLLFGQ